MRRGLGAWIPGSWSKGGWGLEFLGLREEGAGSLDSWLHEGDLLAGLASRGNRSQKMGPSMTDSSLGMASCFANLSVGRGRRAGSPWALELRSRS